MRNRRGEIATILTIGTLIVIGVTAVISSLGLKDKRTTSSRASCVSTQLTCIGETNTVCCDKTTKICGWDSNDKRICVTKPVGNSPTPKPPTSTPATTNGCFPQAECVDECGGTNNCVRCAGSSKYKCIGSTTIPPSVPTTATNTPIPSQDTCTKGQKFTGTLGYNVETPEQICSAHNGVYVGSSQQGQENDTAGKSQRWACCAVSDANSVCPKPGLGYACCVQDTRECPSGDIRYRWYGCTGQVCSATKINTTGGFTHLFDCPLGVNPASPENCSSVLPTPKLSIDGCEDYGSYGLLGGCHEKCTDPSKECKAADGDTVQRFCCPKPLPPPETPPTGCTANSGCSALTCPSTTNKCVDGKWCCPKVVIPPATEETPIPGSSDDCMSIQTLQKCDSTEDGTSGFPVRKKIGNEWNCCKTDTSTPTIQPGTITPGVTVEPTPLPNKPGMTSITCSKYCSDHGGGTTTKNEQIYLSTSGGGSYQDQNGANLGSAYIEISFHCGCVTPSSTPTQKEINNTANTRTFIYSNSCKYSITGWLENEYGNRITVGSGSTGSILSVQPQTAHVKARYHRTNTMMINEHEYTMNGPTYTYDISGNGCNQYQQDEAN